MTLKDTRNATFSPGGAGGHTHSASPDGRTEDLFGPEAAHASRFLLPDDKKVKQTKGTYGQNGSGSSASAALQKSLESRLKARLPTGGLTMFMKGWKMKATPSGRLYCQLVASARPINGTDYGLWPTTRATDGMNGNRSMEGALREYARGGQKDMPTMALWATATVNDATGSQYQNGKNGQKFLKLPGQVKSSAFLATATVRDNKDGPFCPNVPTNALLGRQVWSGSSAPTENKGSLNPEFSFWLMGIPIDACSCISRGIPSSRRSRRSS